eukprot:TRINITY_DN7926_c0_g4_i1.p1 TRINITY_DN7926_c0_g4~~TRINITY_DN7926_c0_g4_i1.p1  ORF type:complete len:749 (-),score=319.80 TRINITY_DN7926_c0_g4_i1:29-2275(-)
MSRKVQLANPDPSRKRKLFVPDTEVIESLLSSFIPEVVEKPEVFLNAQDETKNQILQATKSLYDYGKKYDDDVRAPKAFRSLFVDGLSIDQLWEELQLQNGPMLKYLESRVNELVQSEDQIDIVPATKKQKLEHVSQESENSENSDESMGSFDDGSLDEDEESEGEEGPKKKTTSGDVDFFSFKDMEKFIAQAEKEEAGEEDDTLAVDSEDEDRAMALMYGDISDSEVDDDEDEEDDDEAQSGDEEEESDDDDEEKPAFGENLKYMDDEERRLEKLLDAERERDASTRPAEEKEEKSKTKKKKKKSAPVSKKDTSKLMYHDWFAEKGEDRLNQMDTDSEISFEDFDDLAEEELGGKGQKDQSGEDWEGEDEEGDFSMDEEDEEEMDREVMAKYEKMAKDKRKRIAEGEDVSDDDEDSDVEMGEEKKEKKMSKHDLQQLRLQQRIKRLEEENIADKSWQLKGEVRASNRPQNSLLEEDLEFENASKVAPVITEQVTQDLESIIKYRIIERIFDDPIAKKPIDTKKRDKRPEGIELDSEKSKKSLADIYEEEWKAIAATKTTAELSLREKQQIDLSSLFTATMAKLNALSNSSFTPRKTKEEESVSITSLQPAIAVEDVTPISVSDASRLAPEEIYQKRKKELAGKTELTQEERKRNRQNKKDVNKQKEKIKAAKNKDKPQVLTTEKATEMIKGQKNIKMGKETDTTNYTQSTALFRKLQDEADRATGKKEAPKKETKTRTQTPANNFKL